ncbi:MAG: hypothetical protein H0V43_12170 [Gemmatimonadales bacterium]|nr:hypothetical protein [Gemmatimonadales bacterium]
MPRQRIFALAVSLTALVLLVLVQVLSWREHGRFNAGAFLLIVLASLRARGTTRLPTESAGLRSNSSWTSPGPVPASRADRPRRFRAPYRLAPRWEASPRSRAPCRSLPPPATHPECR